MLSRRVGNLLLQSAEAIVDRPRPAALGLTIAALSPLVKVPGLPSALLALTVLIVIIVTKRDLIAGGKS